MFEKKELWHGGEHYARHRIPGMIVTSKGTLIAYNEARQTGDDWALMDILMQRSVDHGKTFSEFVKLAEGNDDHRTVNNPVMVEDKNGRIHFLYCEDYTINGGRALRRYSDDDGVTWSDPVDITSFIKPDYHNAFAFGPGHGIVTNDGTIMVPIWMVPKFHKSPIKSHTPSVVSMFYSKDNGETWYLGDFLENTCDVKNPNESVAALTSDGEIYINIRFNGCYRAKAYSKTGYSNWEDYTPDYQLPDPQCFGSVVGYNDGEHPHTMIFANCAAQDARTHVTVRASFDDGKNYTVSKLIDAERGGYVEVAVDNKAGLVYIIYEDNWGVSDYLVTFDYEWLIS